MPTLSPTQAPAPVDPQDAVVWHYRTPKHGVQGPMSLRTLGTYRAHLERLNRWGSLRVWRTGQSEADAVLVASLLP